MQSIIHQSTHPFKRLFMMVLIGIMVTLPLPSLAISPEEVEELNTIEKRIIELRSERDALEKELKQESDEAKKEELQKSLDTRIQQKREYESRFEKISLGGLDTARFQSPTNLMVDTEAYDWQKELILIMQPVFSEMQRLTEGPRKRELLRNELKEIQERISSLKKALNYLDNVDEASLTKEAKQKLNDLQKEWRDTLNTIERQQELVAGNLDDMTDDNSVTTRIINSALNFIQGRGLILLISFSAFFGLLYLTSQGAKLLSRRRERQGKTRPISTRARVFLLLYQLLSMGIALFALLTLLHSSGDMVLFGLAILILFILVISFRSSIPAYMRKLRLFLNLGQARERERVIYNGLPWKIEYINLYSVYLVNPALDNGRIRLTIDILANLISRPLKADEFWFPSKVGDNYILPNGQHVVVQRQTPESIYLSHFGGQIVYPTVDFLNAKPNNISKGYSSTINFGLNYRETRVPVEEVIKKVEANVLRVLEEREILPLTKSVTVDFRQVNAAESLLYTVSISMGPNGVDYYYSLPRLMQRTCLETALQEGWGIPKTEVSLSNPNSSEKEESNPPLLTFNEGDERAK